MAPGVGAGSSEGVIWGKCQAAVGVGRKASGASLDPQEGEPQSAKRAGGWRGMRLFLGLREPPLLGERYRWPAQRAQ